MTYKLRITNGDRLFREVSDSGCSVFAGHLKPLTGNYRRQSDGSWKLYAVDGSPTDTSLAAGALEAQSAKVLAAAAAGRTDLKVEVVVQSRSLDELVHGSKIVLAPSAVQWTRSRDGLGGVLRKALTQQAARTEAADPAWLPAMQHLLLVAEMAQRGHWFDAHPPLELRIRLIYGRPMPALPQAAAA